MSEVDVRCLEVFPAWLQTLPDDAEALAELLGDANVPEPVRSKAAGALNYLVKSLDLIPEGIEDLGLIDDAFVLRLTAASVEPSLPEERAPEALPDSAESDSSTLRVRAALRRLASEAELVEGFLGSDFPRLVNHARTLGTITARGRSVEEILINPEAYAQLRGELRVWAAGYRPPTFSRDPKSLVKVRAFLAAKLPS